jgi:hypothetical protein
MKQHGLKQDQDALNEFYRQFPRTEEHAFRDETKKQYIQFNKIIRSNRFQRRSKIPGFSNAR